MIRLAVLLLALAPTAHAASFYDAFTGHYQGVDGYWAHPFSAEFDVSVRNGQPVIRSTNISQARGCDVRVGRFLRATQQGASVTAEFELVKGASCRILDSTIHFTFNPAARGCSEWSPRVRGSFASYRYMDGVHHNIPRTRTVYWGLVKQGGC
jgi:hypothetical protein